MSNIRKTKALKDLDLIELPASKLWNMFFTANGFKNIADIGIDNYLDFCLDTSASTFAAIMTNATFASELYLKFIFALDKYDNRGGKTCFPKGHYLYLLFRVQSLENQEHLYNLVNNANPMSLIDFRKEIQRISNAFISYRYHFEDKIKRNKKGSVIKPSVFTDSTKSKATFVFTGEFMNALETIAKGMINRAKIKYTSKATHSVIIDEKMYDEWVDRINEN